MVLFTMYKYLANTCLNKVVTKGSPRDKMLVRVGLPGVHNFAPLIQYSNTTGEWSGFYYDLVYELQRATGFRLVKSWLKNNKKRNINHSFSE